MDSILKVKTIKSEPDAVENEAYPHSNKGMNFIQVHGGLNLKDEPNKWKLEMPKECVEITIDDIRGCSEDGGKENKRFEQQATIKNNKPDECSSENIQPSNDNNANNQCDKFYTNTNLNMGETVILNDPNPPKYMNSSSQKIPMEIPITRTAGIIRIIAPNEYIVTMDGKYQCTYCKFTSTAKRAKNSVKKHIARCHQKESPMCQCPHCPYKSFSFHDLKSHLLFKHTSDKDIHWYQCDKCNRKYKTKAAVRKHLYSHLSSEELKLIEKNECSICGAVFKRKETIKRHIRFVHNKEKLKCKSCDFSTFTTRLLEHHIQVRHIDSKDLQTHRCQHCNYKTKFLSRFKAHTRIQHTNSERICEICGYKCKTKLNMKLHGITHQKEINEKELKYQCNKCNYKTYRLHSFNVHKLNHLKPSEIIYFYCYHCNFKANRKDNLKTHILRHFKKEEVTLWCYLCDFSTKRRNLLSEHLSIKHKEETGNQQEITDI